MTDEQLTQSVAERVMGWEYLEGWWCIKPINFPNAYWDHLYPVEDWNPLEDMNHAWMIVERMRELGWVFEIHSDWNGDYWRVQLVSDKDNVPDTEPILNPNFNRAILEAALEAVGGNYD